MSNVARPAGWKDVAPAPVGNTTFSRQTSLPRLPVPELSDTLNRLKESLKPISRTEAEYAEVLRKIDDFSRSAGPTLHERLLKRRDATRHWLEEWWDDLGYLKYRDSVVVNVSYYYGFDEHPAHLSQGAISRAAALIRGAGQYRDELRTGDLAFEATKAGPFCMDTYRWMFDCCRIPGLEGADWSVTHAKENPSHILVLREGRFWRVDAWRDGTLLSVVDLEKQLQFIVDNTDGDFPGVGVLTASNRDVWAKDYATLASDPHNAAILDVIQSATFVVCLDTEQPADLVEHSRYLWHGSVTKAGLKTRLGLHNRWVDKPVQFIVFDNGKAGIMGEHSVMDGTPTVNLCDVVLDRLSDPSWDQGQSSGGEFKAPEALDFTISQDTARAIEVAEKAATELVESQAMGITLTKYGKAAIKAYGVSPDSWAQMVVQLAYTRLLTTRGKQREGGTYEAASTRKFLNGRTEAIRVVTNASDAWVKSMDDPHVSAEERRRLFGVAAKTHVSLARAAGEGQGVDRHLLGLSCLVGEGERPHELYADPVYKRAKTWVLSTSAVFSKHFQPYGWGEVMPNGFGVAYMTGFDDYLQYTITSRTEMPNEDFCKEIEHASQELFDLHSSTSASARL